MTKTKDEMEKLEKRQSYKCQGVLLLHLPVTLEYGY